MPTKEQLNWQFGSNKTSDMPSLVGELSEYFLLRTSNTYRILSRGKQIYGNNEKNEKTGLLDVTKSDIVSCKVLIGVQEMRKNFLIENDQSKIFRLKFRSVVLKLID